MSDTGSEIDHLRALCAVHAAEIQTLFEICAALAARSPEIFAPLSFQEFCRQRAEHLLRESLIRLEDKSPGLAAEIQRLIDEARPNSRIMR